MGPVGRRWAALVDDPVPWGLRGASWALNATSGLTGRVAYYTGRAHLYCEELIDQIRDDEPLPPDVKG